VKTGFSEVKEKGFRVGRETMSTNKIVRQLCARIRPGKAGY
jgi:hypothetical protein